MASMTCNHLFGKRAGQNEGKRCSVKVSKEDGLWSKHRGVPADKKKLSIEKWEEVMLQQIPATENRRKTLIPLNLDVVVSSLFYSPGKCNKYSACAVALARMGKRNLPTNL